VSREFVVQGARAQYEFEGGHIKEGGQLQSIWRKHMMDIHSEEELEVGTWFDGNLEMVVGDWAKTLFWLEALLEGVPLCDKFRRLFKLAYNHLLSATKKYSLG